MRLPRRGGRGHRPHRAIWFTDSGIPAYIDQLARPPSLAALAKHRPYHLYRFRAE